MSSIFNMLAVAPDAPVCANAQNVKTRAEMANDIRAAQAALSLVHSPCFVLYEESCYRFMVWLFAAWENGQTAILSPEDLPSFREQLNYPWVGRGNSLNVLSEWDDFASGAKAQKRFDEAGAAFFTSGSTGASKLVHKNPEQLFLEGRVLNDAFGGGLAPETRFAGTVPHQHMFGMPFRIFFPLAGGHVIVNEMYRYPEDLMRLTDAPHVLISSPATLKRLTQLPHIRPHTEIKMIFSAGSPLPEEVALASAKQLDARMIEIYGSTETGYVASREAPDTTWHPQKGVELGIDSETGCLKLKSPLLSGSDWYFTQDRVELKDGGWQIIGRADRVTKIEGQRVSLTMIERMLKEQPEIEDAKAVAIYGEREEVDAVVVLNEFGKRSLKETNKAAFDRMLRQRLRGLLTRAARPRRFRYVDAMPVDAMGKTTQAALVALFSKRPLPEAEIVNRDSFVCRLRLKMSEAKFAFEGHFPKLPVLPGVTQVDWAVRFAQRYLSSGHYWSDGDLSTVNQLKFMRLARPADILMLDLKIEPEKKQLSFHYSLESGEKVSQGVARFRREEEAS